MVDPIRNNKNNKSFRELERHDITAFLDKYRKPEDVDPLHRWIGTYNLTIVLLGRFFKWLHYPDIAPNRRPEPSVMQNIGRLKRREQTTYKPTDTWTLEDDLIFIKYCPSKRDKCFHMMGRDTGTRTHELLKLKIKDIVLTQNVESSQWYAEVMVNGKTGSRSLVMLYSIYPTTRRGLKITQLKTIQMLHYFVDHKTRKTLADDYLRVQYTKFTQSTKSNTFASLQLQLMKVEILQFQQKTRKR
ncbi:MAG: hypothetical protein ACJ70R_05910 [Nitrososphaera sp.]